MKHTMAFLHIQKFDGEHICRVLQLIEREHERRVMLLPGPPLDCRSNRSQRGKSTFAQHTKQIDVREIGMEFSIRRGTVEHDAVKIWPYTIPQTLDEFVDLFFRNHNGLLCFELPASTGAAAAGTTSTEPAKPTTTASAESTSAIAKASTAASREQHPK
jgi:hypothetical protein